MSFAHVVNAGMRRALWNTGMLPVRPADILSAVHPSAECNSAGRIDFKPVSHQQFRLHLSLPATPCRAASGIKSLPPLAVYILVECGRNLLNLGG
jgi:hypothetical protein